MVINLPGAGQGIKHHGVSVVVTNRGDPVYDEDTQVPDYSSGTADYKALVEDPTKTEITHAGGKLTTGSKKFIFPLDATVNTGDLVTYGGVDYDVVLMNDHRNRTIAFGERVQS